MKLTEKLLFSNRDLKKLIIPLTLEQILFMLVGVADTFMVAQLGEEAISGVTLINILEYFMFTLMSSICSGGGIVISQYLGAKQPKEAKHACEQLLSLAMAIGLIFMISGIICHREFLQLLYKNVDASVMEAADTYLFVALFSIPCIAIHQAGSSMFRSMNESRIALRTVIVLNVTNIVGNYLAVYVLHAGVFGVALATVLARILGNLLMLYFAAQKRFPLHINYGNCLSIDGAMVKKILGIALPNGLENGLFAAGKVMMTSIIALFGTVQIAANAVSNTYQIIAIFVVNAINMAMITVVGQCIGAREYEQAKFYVKKLLKISWIATASLSTLGILALPLTLKYYNVSEQTARLVIELVIIHNIAATILQPLCFNLPNAIRATGDVKFSMNAGIGSMLIFRILMAIIFGVLLDWQIYGVWLAMVADWLVRAICFSYRWRSEKWRAYRVV
ncbi:MAG: MATE family efflux transporter [Phascolarctobacterium sp.]|nr:MATE family efflux transporter [Phascolarctobacterium sp.]